MTDVQLDIIEREVSSLIGDIWCDGDEVSGSVTRLFTDLLAEVQRARQAEARLLAACNSMVAVYAPLYKPTDPSDAFSVAVVKARAAITFSEGRKPAAEDYRNKSHDADPMPF